MITSTAWFIIATTLIWIGYDIWLYATDQETISDVIFGWGQNIGGIIFAVGFLCGHWFWPYHVTDPKGE